LGKLSINLFRQGEGKNTRAAQLKPELFRNTCRQLTAHPPLLRGLLRKGCLSCSHFSPRRKPCAACSLSQHLRSMSEHNSRMLLHPTQMFSEPAAQCRYKPWILSKRDFQSSSVMTGNDNTCFQNQCFSFNESSTCKR